MVCDGVFDGVLRCFGGWLFEVRVRVYGFVWLDACLSVLCLCVVDVFLRLGVY